MNVVVEERTREIGIKMALGAKQRWILSQFLLETLLVTMIGGAFGFAISLGICAIFPESLYEYVGKPEVYRMRGVALGDRTGKCLAPQAIGRSKHQRGYLRFPGCVSNDFCSGNVAPPERFLALHCMGQLRCDMENAMDAMTTEYL
jgi:ABC-type antimicrobial peptide transport system permease subunit